MTTPSTTSSSHSAAAFADGAIGAAGAAASSVAPLATADQPAAAIDHRTHVQALVHFFETVSAANVQQVDTIYAADAYFKDPFNEVRGVAAIRQLFAHMFVQVKDPRFIVTGTVAQGDQVFLTWDFYFFMPRFAVAEQCMRGVTHFHFDAQGKVSSHRDYWDAAEELYEKLPVLGSIMRILKRIARK